MGLREEEVVGQVRHAIARHPRLDAPQINITMIGETLALSGVVDTEEMALAAEQAAKAAAPGVPIDNSLTVSMSQHHGVRHGWQDSELQQSVEQAVATAADSIKGRPISVSVEVVNGFAHLRGSCSTGKDRLVIIQAVNAVKGIKRVIADDFEVAPFGNADDIRLGNLAEERLAKEAPDLAAAVKVDVRNRSAHLLGSVRSGVDRCRAEDIVLQAPGIKQVHNELRLYQDEASSDPEVKIEQAVRHAIGAAGLPKPNIHVFYTRGVLTIDGEVESPDQRHQAIMIANDVLKQMVGEVYQISDMLKITSRRGFPPHDEDQLVQHGRNKVGNTPMIPLETTKGPTSHDKSRQTARIEDRTPEYRQPQGKRKHQTDQKM